MSNSVKLKDGTELYTNKIYELVDEYINTLEAPETMKGSNLFNGIIKYIYINLFKIQPLDNADIESIDNIWGIYTSLCYKYNKRPTILNFSLMVGINPDTINSWKNGEYRGGLGSPHSETVKKWLAECESALFDGAIEQNSIGCIFALKANYGYTETAPIPTINKAQVQSIEQIRAKYKAPELCENGTQLEFPKGDF